MEENRLCVTDLQQGIFDLGLGVAISPMTTEAELKDAISDIAPLIINTPWHSYRLPASQLLSLPVLSSAWFHDGLISQLHLSRNPSENTSWETWTEEGMQADKTQHDQWLAQLLGEPPYSFAWGTIESSMDLKGGSSSIIVSFERV